MGKKIMAIIGFFSLSLTITFLITAFTRNAQARLILAVAIGCVFGYLAGITAKRFKDEDRRTW